MPRWKMLLNHFVTGLGFSIVFEIIKKHDGTTELESCEGEGTTFTFSLPVEDIDTDPVVQSHE